MAGFNLADILKVEESQFKAHPRGFYRMDARFKLLLTGLAVGLNVALARMDLSMGLGLVAWGGMLLSRVPLNQMAWFLLAPLWATLGIMAGYSVGFGATAIAKIGPLTVYQEGVWQGLGVVARVMADMGWVGLLFLTTPFPRILDALRWLRVPGVLVDTLGFMYRYVFLLWDEFSAMHTSAKARGGMATTFGGMKSVGAIIAQIFLRAYDRAERIQQAVQARGGA
jgi:cobalt ECF transporter T component CbiQ